MKNYTDKQLVDIFTATEKTIFDQSSISSTELAKSLEQFKKIKREKRTDNEYFKLIVRVTFYSGFKAKTVTEKLPEIEKVFNDYLKVAKYTDSKVLEIKENKNVIGNEKKIKGIIYNANEIIQVVKQFGSFDKYLASFGKTEEEANFMELVKDLKRRFKFLGGITVFHFLTDIGFNVVKPDRVLCRIFYRLRLIENEEDHNGVLTMARRISLATNQPIRYIDIIFVLYGQVGEKIENGISSGICLEKNPKCDICGVFKYCQYDKV